MFQDFAKKAFTKRRGSDFPGIKYLVEVVNEGRFETTGLNAVLKESFGQARIFGEARNLSGRKELKVGVTMTSSTGHPYFAANFNRPMLEKRMYIFTSIVYLRHLA
jgi:hypothetical protein